MTTTPPRIKKLRSLLLAWAEKNARQYPWRWLDNPYNVLVAEFMLHRTQTKQVLPVYERFMHLYPNLETYAKADQSQVETILMPLGLHWRISGMIQALNELWRKYQEVPKEPAKLMEVRGIGQYIANATFCFTQNEPTTLIDTNIVRVIGRIFGLELSGEARRRKSVIEAISKTCDPLAPRDYYYAIIDLAHSICTPKNPKCEVCPLLKVPCQWGNQRVSKNRKNPGS